MPNIPPRPDAPAHGEAPPADAHSARLDGPQRPPTGWQHLARRLCRAGGFDAGRVAGVLHSLEAGLYVTDAVVLADGVLAAQAPSQRH